MRQELRLKDKLKARQKDLINYFSSQNQNQHHPEDRSNDRNGTSQISFHQILGSKGSLREPFHRSVDVGTTPMKEEFEQTSGLSQSQERLQSQNGYIQKLKEIQDKGSLDRDYIKILHKQNRQMLAKSLMNKFSKEKLNKSPSPRLSKPTLAKTSVIDDQVLCEKSLVLNSNFNFEKLDQNMKRGRQNLRIFNRTQMNKSVQYKEPKIKIFKKNQPNILVQFDQEQE